MRAIESPWLGLIAIFCFALKIFSLAPIAIADTQSIEEKRLLVTVTDNGASDFERGYHRPGYASSTHALQTMAEIGREYRLTQVDSWPIAVLHMYCAVMTVAADGDSARVLAQLQKDRRVALAQPLQTFQVHANQGQAHAGYNDPYFALQFGAQSAQIEQWHRRATGVDVRIAVVDTGVDRTHPDLQHRLQLARNFVGGDMQFDSDIHGTAVAGIIAANANNGIGIVGIAPSANLLALKACWQPDPRAIAAQCSSFTLAKALSFAIEQHVDIINLSLGGPDDALLSQLLRVALTRGILVVAAQNARDEFPANVPGVIAVTALPGSSLVAREWTQPGGGLAAGASELLSTSPGGRYDFFSGSSMAAARVTGLTALMRQGQRQLTAAQMLDTVEPWLAPTMASSDY